MGTRWRRLLPPLPLGDPAPHLWLGMPGAGGVDVGPMRFLDGGWPDWSCWACMDAYAPWAIRAGLTYPLDVMLGGAR